MLTIVSIRFGSAKVYQYLLDSRSIRKPEAGETLRVISSCQDGRTMYKSLHVVRLDEMAVLPERVTNVLRVTGPGLETTDHRMSDKSLTRLRHVSVPSKTTDPPSPRVGTGPGQPPGPYLASTVRLILADLKEEKHRAAVEAAKKRRQKGYAF